MRHFDMTIGGSAISTNRKLDVINPATGAVFATCSRASQAELNSAVAAAKAAFSSWSRRSYAERKSLMLSLADRMEQRSNEFARLLTEEQGKPLDQAQYEVGGSIAMLRAFAEMQCEDEVLRADETQHIVRQRYPLGVIAAITPWNFPLLLLMMKLAPALIAGNTMVSKPAPTTPLTTALLGEVAGEILPDGVFNVIIDANDLGQILAEHPDVAKISFTGSTETGRKVMSSAATAIKRLTLELGGNDAAILLDDMDVEEAALQIFGAAMMNAGQVCLAAKRVYAPRSRYDALCDALARLANEAIVDDGLKQGTTLGPLQNKAQFDKVMDFVEDGRTRGKIIAGGTKDDRDGYFVRPTIVRDIPDDARLVREEQFGPVLPVLAYDNLEEVMQRVNDSDYGLGATIWTTNPERGIALASQVEVGTVWVNKHLDLPFDIPFGGAKQSGLGNELGKEGLEEFTQARIVNAALSDRTFSPQIARLANFDRSHVLK